MTPILSFGGFGSSANTLEELSCRLNPVKPLARPKRLETAKRETQEFATSQAKLSTS